MTSPATRYGIDLEYLKRCKSSTPEQRLDWLMAAMDFVQEIDSSKSKQASTQD